MEDTVAVIGGGAAGLVAAITAAENGRKVIVYEKNDIPGKKLLATGNGKCNLTNADMEEKHFYSDRKSFMKELLQEYTPGKICEFFYESGVMVKEKNGYYYPTSEQASTVREMLENRAVDAGVRFVMGETITKLEKQGKKFLLQGRNQTYTANRVILATGGKAYPQSGSDGSGYALAQGLGHSLTPLHPSLVQMLAKDNYCKRMAGVRIRGEVSFNPSGSKKGIHYKDLGEVQLTEYGISGIPVFQISGYLNQELENKKEVCVTIDFLPDLSMEQCLEEIKKRQEKYGSRTIDRGFSGIIHQKVMNTAWVINGIDPGSIIREIQTEKIQKVFETLKAFPFHVTGSKPYEQAQVTRGGIPLSEVDKTFQSTKVPGLFLCGEILNVDGICGGYNLHFAWSSGRKAGMLGNTQKETTC